MNGCNPGRGAVEFQFHDGVDGVTLGRRHADFDTGLTLFECGRAAGQYAIADDLARDGGHGDGVARPAQNVEVDGVPLVRAAAPPVAFRQDEAACVGWVVRGWSP